jgi:hypothetical protein
VGDLQGTGLFPLKMPLVLQFQQLTYAHRCPNFESYIKRGPTPSPTCRTRQGGAPRGGCGQGRQLRGPKLDRRVSPPWLNRWRVFCFLALHFIRTPILKRTIPSAKVGARLSSGQACGTFASIAYCVVSGLVRLPSSQHLIRIACRAA